MRKISFLLAMVLGFVTVTSGGPRTKPLKRDDVILQKMYAYYNHTLFGDSLPADTQVVWQNLSMYDALGLTAVVSDGRFEIQIDPNMSIAAVTTEETLIHEMCHVKTIPLDPADSAAHGPKFQACMKGVALEDGFVNIW